MDGRQEDQTGCSQRLKVHSREDTSPFPHGKRVAVLLTSQRAGLSQKKDQWLFNFQLLMEFWGISARSDLSHGWRDIRE
jgi:hypothetical protein